MDVHDPMLVFSETALCVERYCVWTRIPWSPSPSDDRARMLRLVPVDS